MQPIRPNAGTGSQRRRIAPSPGRAPRRLGTSVVSGLLAACALSPALGQVDLAGEWAAVPAREVVDNPQLGELVGLPLSADALRQAEIWDPEIESLPVWQCRPPSGIELRLGVPRLRIWKQVDGDTGDLIAFRVAAARASSLPIYMDGRAHPSPHARHTWTGFATGEWAGGVLAARTTHLKAGYYRRNGAPQSDRAEFSEFLIRRRFRDRDYLTWVVVADDPVSLSEPLIGSRDYRREARGEPLESPCPIVKPANGTRAPVPRLAPGADERLGAFARSYDIPPRARSDGAATLYPEYRSVIDAWRARERSGGDGAPAPSRQ